jgi:hypothetical protein
MKKIFILILAMICLLGIFGCTKDSSDVKGASAPSQEATEPFDDSELREKFSEYYAIRNDMKGVEVYIWEIADGEYRCGAMEGTNRYKQPDELTSLTKNGATIEEMKIILSSCDISREDVHVELLKECGTDMYETDGTADYKAVEKTFWGN